jgi:hypothetical protein
MKYPLVDPTFEYLQHEPPTPGSVGIVRSVSGSTAQVYFQGSTLTARYPASGTLVAGDSVSVVNTEGMWWALKSSAGYPSRYPRPLADFAGTNPASVLLCYLLKDNPRTYTYRACVVLAVLSTALLSISMGDRTLSVGVEYAGVSQTTTGISAGDTVLAYQRNPGDWVALAKASVTAPIVRLYWAGAAMGTSGGGGWTVTGMSVVVGQLSGTTTSLPYDLHFEMTPQRPLWTVTSPAKVGGVYVIPAGTALPHIEPVTFFYSSAIPNIATEWVNAFMLGENVKIIYPTENVDQTWVTVVGYPNPLALP